VTGAELAGGVVAVVGAGAPPEEPTEVLEAGAPVVALVPAPAPGSVWVDLVPPLHATKANAAKASSARWVSRRLFIARFPSFSTGLDTAVTRLGIAGPTC
jgi:hypothetical protein